MFVSVGGMRLKNLFEPAIATVKSLFHSLDITYAGEVVFSGIDEKGEITRHPDAMHQAFLAGQKLVEEAASE